MKDVFGMEYKLDMSTDYSTKVNTFAEGVVKIKDEQILCSYRNSKENFIFQLALDILKKSKACQLYLQAKYFKFMWTNIRIATRICMLFYVYL